MKRKTSAVEKLVSIFLLLLFFFVLLFHKEIVHYSLKLIDKEEMVVLEPNNYEKTEHFSFISETNSFHPAKKEDLIKIIYTILNRGWNDFTFYCEYENCIDDVNELTQDQELMSHLNNFVHPYNSFQRIYVTTNVFGKVNIKIEKSYSEEQIAILDQKIEEIWNSEIKDGMTTKEKIQVIHDYIINHTIYDKKRADEIESGMTGNPSTYQSHIAYGPLIEGYAICGGYSDAMALFLTKMGLPNYKISSQNHVWNFVSIDNHWYHLDLTWDDPVVSTGEQLLFHNFFLITTEELESKNTNQHQFAKEIYQEAR